jgi:hypothetical protein
MVAINAVWLRDISTSWRDRKRPPVAPAGLTKLGCMSENPTTDFVLFLAASQQVNVSTWGSFMLDNGTFVNAIAAGRAVNAQQHRVVPLEIAWSFPGSINLAATASGADDAYIRARAREIKDYGGPVYLRLNWEMNGDWYAWASYNVNTPIPGNTPADYIAAWRRTVNIVRYLAPNASFIWCPHLWVFHSQTPDLWYPGDQWVDWTGVTAYPGSAVWDWVENGDWGLTVQAAFAVAHGKPFRICEWGAGQGDTPTNVGTFYQFTDWVVSHPVCREIVYFHVVGLNGINYRLEAYPDWQYAYRLILTTHPERWPQI